MIQVPVGRADGRAGGTAERRNAGTTERRNDGTTERRNEPKLVPGCHRERCAAQRSSPLSLTRSGGPRPRPAPRSDRWAGASEANRPGSRGEVHTQLSPALSQPSLQESRGGSVNGESKSLCVTSPALDLTVCRKYEHRIGGLSSPSPTSDARHEDRDTHCRCPTRKGTD